MKGLPSGAAVMDEIGGIDGEFGADMSDEEEEEDGGSGEWQLAGCPQRHEYGSPGLRKKLLHWHFIGPFPLSELLKADRLYGRMTKQSPAGSRCCRCW